MVTANRLRQVARTLFFTTAIAIVGTHTGKTVHGAPEAPRASANCAYEWILCGGESIEADTSQYLTEVYIQSGLGTGRFGLRCYNYGENCWIFSAHLSGSTWSDTWSFAAGQTPVQAPYPARWIYMHGSGNLQVFDAYWNLVWETGTTMSETDAYLNIHDSGCAAIWHENDSGSVWDSCDQ